MAVTAELKIYPGATFSATDMAIYMEHVLPNSVGILTGCKLTKVDASTINIESGYCYVRGRLLKVNGGSLAIPMPTSETKYSVVVQFSLSTGVCEVKAGTSFSGSGANLNAVNGTEFITLGWVWSGSAGITTIKSRYLIDNPKNYAKIMGTAVSGAPTKITAAGTRYELYEVSLRPGLYLLCGYANFGGVTNGVGVSSVGLWDVASNSGIGAVTTQHTTNNTISLVAYNILNITDAEMDRSETKKYRVYVSSSTANRTISAGLWAQPIN